MPNLKDLRNRITSVKSTQKITSAMKMVAAAKLRRAQEQADRGAALRRAHGAHAAARSPRACRPAPRARPPLLAGTGSGRQVHLIVVATSDRGLCGGFNATIAREAQGICIRRRYRKTASRSGCFVHRAQAAASPAARANTAIADRRHHRRTWAGPISASPTPQGICRRGSSKHVRGRLEFDVCTIIYNHFRLGDQPGGDASSS